MGKDAWEVELQDVVPPGWARVAAGTMKAWKGHSQRRLGASEQAGPTQLPWRRG